MPLALYVQYQLSFRVGAAVQATAQGEWRAKTKAQKAAWKAAYEDLRRKLDISNDVNGNAAQLQNNFNQERVNGDLNIENQADYDEYIARCNEIQAECGENAQAAADVQKAWEGLRDVENEQPNPVQQSINQATLGANAAANIVQRARNAQGQAETDKRHPPVALDAFGRQRIPARWLLLEDQSKSRYEIVVGADYRAHHLGMDHGDARRWIPQQNLSGGMSKAWVWVAVDDGNVIRDRVFRKDVLLGEHAWVYPTKWTGDIRDRNRMPLELDITHAMSHVENFTNSVRLRKDPDRSHLNDDTLSYRMYLQWVGGGDLFNLINRHIQAGSMVPEPFIWAVAEALAECGITMRQGNGWAPPPPTGWQSIIHRDLKPQNVFLDEAPGDSRYWPDYSKVVLGDYGLAIKTTPDDPMNPRWYRNAGTHGFRAPEQEKPQVDRLTLATIDNFPLSEKSNVYGIGLILWCLMHNHNLPPQPLWLDDPKDVDHIPIHGNGLIYSPDLRELVEQSLRYDPGDRPSLDELLQLIYDATTDDGRIGSYDQSEGMRLGTAVAGVQMLAQPLFRADPYHVGLAQPAPMPYV